MPSALKHVIAVAFIAACTFSSAQGAIISGSTSFSAWGFGNGAPADPVTGTVSFSFDNSANIFNAPDGAVANGVSVEVSILGISLPGNWSPVLTYFRNAVVNNIAVQDVLAIGNLLNGTLVIAGTEDWRVAFNNASGQLGFRELTYSTASTDRLFISTTGVVPEPGALSLAGLAIGMLALARRRRAY
jgi:hypothetical protein